MNWLTMPALVTRALILSKRTGRLGPEKIQKIAGRSYFIVDIRG